MSTASLSPSATSVEDDGPARVLSRKARTKLSKQGEAIVTQVYLSKSQCVLIPMDFSLICSLW